MSVAKHLPSEESPQHSIPPEAAAKLYELERLLGRAYIVLDDLREILGLSRPTAKLEPALLLRLQKLER